MDTDIQVYECFSTLLVVNQGDVNQANIELNWYEQVDSALGAELLYYRWLPNEVARVHQDKGEYDLFILMIIYEMNRELGEGSFGIKEIAERMATNYKAVQKAIKRLVEFRALERLDRPGGKALFHILLSGSYGQIN